MVSVFVSMAFFIDVKGQNDTRTVSSEDESDDGMDYFILSVFRLVVFCFHDHYFTKALLSLYELELADFTFIPMPQKSKPATITSR